MRAVFFAVEGVLGAWGRGALPCIGFEKALACAVVEVADSTGVGAAGRAGALTMEAERRLPSVSPKISSQSSYQRLTVKR
ncbi:hypothetical protein D3C72_1102750 [compost metagenome]